MNINKWKAIICSLVIPVFLVFVLPTFAAWTQRQKITATPTVSNAQFGNAVAINGNTMVVGAGHDNTTAQEAGAAYVYRLNGSTWTLEAVLLANDGAALDKFGSSVAISEDTIVVGAYQDDAGFSNNGSAYVFVRNPADNIWSQQQKLTASDGTANDEFGNSVGMIGELIVVGAHFADIPGTSSGGSVYLYRRSGTVWTQTQKLLPTPGPFGVFGNYFGESVAVSNKIAIGASGDNTPETAAGAVYVFAENGGGNYVLEQKLNISNGTNGDNFGCSVAIEGGILIGGAREDTAIIGQQASGAAYVYEFNGSTWQSAGKLTASDGAATDRFGWSVAVSDNFIAVGARNDDTIAGIDAGSVYIFARNNGTWTQTQKIAPADSVSNDRFGESVALSFGNLAVGAALKTILPSGQGAGAAYYFTPDLPKVKFDFDGDGKADISIFRPVNGQWWYQRSFDNSVSATTFGASTDKPVPADYTGDGKTDIAVWRPDNGNWYILRSEDSSFFAVPFGISTDKPAPGDFDGDGLADITVFRGSEGVWYLNKSSGGVQITQWGTAGDVPVQNDYDGDGKSDFAIFRPSNGQWWLNRSTAGIIAATFGVNTDKPVAADYTGDGKTDIAVWRPANGSWYVLRSEDSSFFAIPFGSNGDIPVAGDYDGDGKADTAVFRPDGSNWFIQRSTQGILIQQFGASGDLPAPSAFVP
jgi:hypothetical protein